MATFYGQVKGNAETEAGRRGTYGSGIRPSVQSWDGSVITSLKYGDQGELRVQVETSDGSEFYGRTIFDGTFDEFVKRLQK